MSNTVSDRNIFNYPGGKCTLAPWIIDHLPKHTTYVEVFGGSAAVLLGKSESKIEVYNDLDGDIVHFFRTFRERTDELAEFLRRTPYARDIHDEWSRLYYDGYRPSDDIERAGRWFYLRFTQFASKYHGRSGFKSMRQRNPASQYNDARDRLTEFARRFDGVQIENLDYADLFDRFDGDDTVFYCDPPYVEEGDEWYSHGVFDHERFVAELENLAGKWVVSYTDVPDPLQEYEIRERAIQYNSQNSDGSHKDATERLVLNFDPDQTPLFSESGQQTLGELGHAGQGGR